jgi:hypothetical protein
MSGRSPQFNAPIFLGSAFILLGLAILEKVLNLFGKTVPLLDVLPSRALEWAVTLLMFEIALSIRQLIEVQLEQRRDSKTQTGPDAD